MQYFKKSSAKSALAARSLNATSGSIIQNSARCLLVLLFSARNVGPKVYTFPSASAANSASSCPLTVRCVCFPKKSSPKSIVPSSLRGGFSRSKLETVNISPAPSASLPVMIGA